MNKEVVLEIKNVKKQIGKKRIIKDLSFDVYAGEVFGFLGPNGAGKTTTIRMIMGLISITEGDILIKGHSVKNDFKKAIVNVGGIVENPDMYKYLSGYENLLHYARMYKGITKERIDEVVKLVGLEKRIKDKVKTYSLGMKQRLGVAQALLNSPSLLILDEPTNGLDPAGIHELRNDLRVLAEKENVAVFVSSHLLSEMELMCDRVGIIQNGDLVDIQTLTGMLAEDNNLITLEVDEADMAKECLINTFADCNPNVKGRELEVTLERDQVPEAIRKLVEAKVNIYKVTNSNVSLEDKFLEVTGGNEIA